VVILGGNGFGRFGGLTQLSDHLEQTGVIGFELSDQGVAGLARRFKRFDTPRQWFF
jgi:hypothetical protein